MKLKINGWRYESRHFWFGDDLSLCVVKKKSGIIPFLFGNWTPVSNFVEPDSTEILSIVIKDLKNETQNQV